METAGDNKDGKGIVAHILTQKTQAIHQTMEKWDDDENIGESYEAEREEEESRLRSLPLRALSTNEQRRLAKQKVREVHKAKKEVPQMERLQPLKKVSYDPVTGEVPTVC